MTVDREHFAQLADAFEQHVRDARAASNPRAYVDHESFRAIVAIGADAIPWIVERYQTGSLFWGAALAQITKRTDFGDGLSGNLKETRAKWLNWAAQQTRS